ncbi:MAG TPA: RNA polymerase sigma-70 factor [Draconibacterium sp.]|nr:RNA polymerase sigma-70 factor [Draconibacterium sp.]
MKINEQTPDDELVEKLQKDDQEAFDQIFKRYGDRLFGFALKYLKSKEETEGLVQDVFLKIWEKRKKIKKESSLKSYLFTIAYHDMCRIFRKKQIYLKFIEESGTDEQSAIDHEEQMEYKVLLDQVNQLIEKLPNKQKQIFIKSRREGKSTKEIAEEMNLAPGTVNNYISTTLKFLKLHITGENLALILFLEVFIQ